MPKLHLADTDPQNHGWAAGAIDKSNLKLRILISFWYYGDSDLDQLFEKHFADSYPDVFADSGAFSAFYQGQAIDVAAYADWLSQWEHLFTSYANLDVKGSTAKTIDQGLSNLAYLEGRGLKPIPVFHAGEPFSVLDDLCTNYKYLGLGGIAGTRAGNKRLARWLVHCFKIAGDRAVFHGFGMTSWALLKMLPWYSVDSSSWGAGFRYGTVPIFNPQKGIFLKIRLGDRKRWIANASLVQDMGFDPVDFAIKGKATRPQICAISALSYMLAEQWLRRIHGDITIPGNKDVNESGPKTHLADANPQRFGDAVDGGGLLLHLADTSSGINWGDANQGLRCYLADVHPPSDFISAKKELSL